MLNASTKTGAWWAGWLTAVAMVIGGCGNSSNHYLPTDGGPGGSNNTGGSGTGGVCSNCGGGNPTGGNAGGATGGGAGTGGGVQAPECTGISDCAGRSDGKIACDIAHGVCVGCVVASNCAAGQDCVANKCVAGKTCANSLDCSGGQVCDVTAQRCVECVQDADCTTGSHCVGNLCRATCRSDKDCTPLGLLCNTLNGYCAQCVTQADCKTAEYCSQSKCVPDVCAAGTSTCSANSVLTCNGDGSGTLPPVACATNQTCVRQGTKGTCVNQICTPDVHGCQAGAEKVVVCSSDGLSQQVTQDCGASGEVCVAAACKPIVCVANSTYCAAPELRKCSTKGDSSVLLATCSSTQFCNAASSRCDAQLCTPNGPACKQDIATTCNADGSGYQAGGTDCASSGLHCVGGVCKDQLCAPSTRFCQAGSVQLCSADGLSSSLYQSCTATQYCDAATASCKAQICSPNAATCNGNNKTTCNSDGSGYTAAGTDCGTQYCVSGVCQDALFAENWEDGDSAGWSQVTTAYYATTGTVTTSYAANSTAHSLSLYSTYSGYSFDGLYHTFTNLKPTHVGYWARMTSTSTYGGDFVLTSSTSTTTRVAYMEFDYGLLYLNGSYTTSYVANAWYHIELRNINWTNKTYDWYVNDALIRSAVPFYSASAVDIVRLDLFNYYATTSYIDEIIFN